MRWYSRDRPRPPYSVGPVIHPNPASKTVARPGLGRRDVRRLLARASAPGRVPPCRTPHPRRRSPRTASWRGRRRRRAPRLSKSSRARLGTGGTLPCAIRGARWCWSWLESPCRNVRPAPGRRQRTQRRSATAHWRASGDLTVGGSGNRVPRAPLGGHVDRRAGARSPSPVRARPRSANPGTASTAVGERITERVGELRVRDRTGRRGVDRAAETAVLEAVEDHADLVLAG